MGVFLSKYWIHPAVKLSAVLASVGGEFLDVGPLQRLYEGRAIVRCLADVCLQAASGARHSDRMWHRATPKAGLWHDVADVHSAVARAHNSAR